MKHAALVLFGLTLGLATLELGLRATGWVLARQRLPVRLPGTLGSGTIRILCLGESTTFGLGVSPRDAYPAQLEQILNARGDGRSYVVFNAGVPATTSDRIVAALEENLARYRPNIVVTMMGINDGPFDDPVFPVHASLRVLKLARLLAVWAGGMLRGEQRAPDRGIVEIPRANGRPVSYVPRKESLKLYFASLNVIAGRFDEAERQLLPLANRSLDEESGRFIAMEAVGQLVLLNHQWGREDEARRYHRRYQELVGGQPNPKTAANYTTLQRIVEARGLPLVVVEYPGRSVQPLRKLLAGGANVALVDNEETFLRVVKERPLKESFQDLFAGIFGHMTPAGNRLLAANVAATIDRIVERPRTAGTTP